MIIKPDSTEESKNKSIFLAGTIDDGNSVDWQELWGERIHTFFWNKGIKVDILNPRRTDWNKGATKEMKMRQIAWERYSMNKSDLIVMNFLPKSLSPITLLELGRYSDTGKLLVCCPEEFWRYENVEFECIHNNIPLFNNMEDLVLSLKSNKWMNT